MDGGRLSERFLKARDYRDLLGYVSYGRLSAFLKGRADEIAERASTRPFATVQEEHDALAEARAYRSVLRHVEEQAAAFDRARKAAEGAGLASGTAEVL